MSYLAGHLLRNANCNLAPLSYFAIAKHQLSKTKATVL